MTADEMFETLGYSKRVLKEGNYIEYGHTSENPREYYIIAFEKLDHTISISLYSFTKGKIESKDLIITLEELKAINKKVEELGW